MTVSAQTPINRSTGNGVTTVFPYDFKILAAADILVTVDGVAKTLNVDYTVSGVGVGAGGNITMTVAPANLSSVVRRRNMALVRTTDYQDQGELPAATLDADIDATVLMVQQVDEQIGRALTLPAGVAGVSAELPEPVSGGFFGWNTAADALENKTVESLGAVDISTLVQKTSTTGSAQLPVGDTAQQDGGQGAIRFNSQLLRFEGHNGTEYGALGVDATDYLNTTRINVASSSTTDLTSSAPNTRNINITGTTTITAFTVAIGQTYFVRFNAALTLTNNANIVTQTGANITTSAGDTCIIRATAANTVEVLSYSYSAIVPDLSITPAKLSQKSTLGTAVNTTSGTSIDFTGIPSWAKRITVMFDGVSTSGTSNPLIQIGDSGGIENTGYKASSSLITTGVSTSNYTTGYGVLTALASNTLNGSLVLTLMDVSTNKWTISGVVNTEANTLTATVAGVKSLSATLDRIRLTTVGGADTFDAGSINILYE